MGLSNKVHGDRLKDVVWSRPDRRAQVSGYQQGYQDGYTAAMHDFLGPVVNPEPQKQEGQ